MSNKGKLIIQKLSVLNLVWIAAFIQIGFWSGINSIDNYPAQILLNYWIPKIDPFYTLTACLFLGFSILWIIALIQGVVRKEAMIALLVLLAIAGGLTLIVVSPSGTFKGWFVMGYLNTFTFALNALFALIYFFVGRVSQE